jgi:type IV pilus assembly protein PilC
VEADSLGVAAARLRSEGYFITAIAPDALAPAALRVAAAEGARTTARMLGVFCQQLGTLLKAGVPLTGALRVAAAQPGRRAWTETINRVRGYVEAGESLSGALSHFPRSFPNLMVRLIEAGEAAGTLDRTFERLGEHYLKEHELRQKILGSLTYPAVILVVALTVVTILLVFVLPNFVEMFTGLGLELPVPTRLLLAVGRLVQANGLFLLLALSGLFVGGGLYVRTEGGARARDAFLLRLPLLRDLLLQRELSRFAHTFGTLIAGGVPALQAMQIVSRVADNRVLGEVFARIADQVRGGLSLAGGMEKARIIPGMMVQMVAVGETTGSLDLVLENVADLYDREVDNRLKRLTTLIEPAVIVIVGLVVAVIISSVMLPLFEMIGKVQS